MKIEVVHIISSSGLRLQSDPHERDDVPMALLLKAPEIRTHLWTVGP